MYVCNEADTEDGLKKNLFDDTGIRIEKTNSNVNVCWYNRRYCGRRFVEDEPKVLFEYPSNWTVEQVYDDLDLKEVARLCGYACAMRL